MGASTVSVQNTYVRGAGKRFWLARNRVNRLGASRIPVRIYEPAGVDPWATLIWAHGGSFVRGTLDWPEADWVARRFAERGIRVLSVDYLLASDRVKAPAPANDVASVLRHARATYSGFIAVGGASAGGYLATHAGLICPGVAEALLLLYPTLHRVQRVDEAVVTLTRELPEAQQFGAERIAEMYSNYLGKDETPVIGELGAEHLRALPPTTIVAAELDDLRVSAEMFAEQLTEAGVPVALTVQEGALHGFANRPEASAQATNDALAAVDYCVAALCAGLAR